MTAGPIGAVPPRPGKLGVLIGLGSAMVVAGIAYKVGPLVAVAAAALGVGAVLLLSDPRAALLAYVVLIVLLEGDKGWGVPATTLFYTPTPFHLLPNEFLLLIAVGAVVLDLAKRGERVRAPTPFTAPLTLAAFAMVFGFVNGLLSGPVNTNQVVGTVKTLLALLIVPVLAVNVLRTREDLRRLVGGSGVLAIVKAFLGLGVVVTGLAASSPGLPALTYYEPTANWLMMMFLLAMLAAALSGTPTARWAKVLTPVVFLALLLSYRRTMWLGTSAGAVAVLLTATGAIGRRLLLPGVVVLVGIGSVVFSSGVVDLQGPVVKRARSISLSHAERNQQDRYRIAERKNALAEIGRRPIDGVGIGAGWNERYPVSFEFPFGHYYVHIAALWYWLHMGLLGLAAYLWLFVAGVVVGVRVWRNHPDELVRLAGVAIAGGLIGMMVVELASTVVGADGRGTTVFAVLLSVLSVAWRHCTEGFDAQRG